MGGGGDGKADQAVLPRRKSASSASARSDAPCISGLCRSASEFKAFDPALSKEDAASQGIAICPADELFATSDLISLHAPANKMTTNFVNAERLKTMRPNAMIVNAARGQLIVEDDLAAALKAGTIAGAALDVFHKEPLVMESPLREAPNLLLTPHAAWYSDAAIGKLQGLVANDIARALNGEDPRRPVPGALMRLDGRGKPA